MGTGFTADTPVRVARYGIASVMQIDDILMEELRGPLCEEFGEPYEPIPGKDARSRPLRVRAYLDLIDRVVRRQIATLRAQPFTPTSDITRYFALLPGGPLRTAWLEMCATTDTAQRAQREQALRAAIAPGSIDINCMTKLDRDRFDNGTALPADHSDGSTGIRAFVESAVDGAVVFSAGMNPRLFTYCGQFAAFRPDAEGRLRKRIVLKVSDYRSALIQGRFMAKRGLWISEYRIESGLNCGGHAFGGDGLLMGPVLEQFLRERGALQEQLHPIYDKAAQALGAAPLTDPLPIRVTAQGGIGTASEDEFLRRRYGLDGTGWGTPFLLVPEVTNVDDRNRALLAQSTRDDVWLSSSSPLGVPFWNLRNSTAELERQRRIADQHPGSPCRRGFLALFNREFSERPLCLASREYQAAKLKSLDAAGLDPAALAAARAAVLEKACICHDLAGGALVQHGVGADATPAVCPGPNIVNFSEFTTLDAMVDHIYGRASLPLAPDRPHVLIRELELNLDFLRTRVTDAAAAETFAANLEAGITYYEGLADELPGSEQDAFRAGLAATRAALRHVTV